MYYKTNKFKTALLVLLVFSVTVAAQKQSKKYSEKFTVNPDATVEINTSYTDIEFETWNKNTVEVEGYIEVEGVTKEEAEKYFKGWNFEALGNSSKVTISTKPNVFFHKDMVVMPGNDLHFEDFDIRIEEAIQPMIVELKKMPPLPPMPRINEFNFDFEAYKKDGDKYLEKWKKEFDKSFDKEYKQKLEAWRKEVEKNREEIEKFKVKVHEQNKKISENFKKNKEEIIIRKKEAEARAAKLKKEKKNVFWFSSDTDKKVKIKKVIKIKMPKGIKLKLNVRHGEVKLAENIKNIKATLSHARLLAQVVDGNATVIKSSFAPVFVNTWNRGKLHVNYAEEVKLNNVAVLDLETNASNVVIDNIKEQAKIFGKLGSLHVNEITNSFTDVHLDLNNTEAVIILPKTSFSFNLESVGTTFTIPKRLQTNSNKQGRTVLVNGFYQKPSSNKNITIMAKYSDVVMQ